MYRTRSSVTELVGQLGLNKGLENTDQGNHIWRHELQGCRQPSKARPGELVKTRVEEGETHPVFLVEIFQTLYISGDTTCKPTSYTSHDIVLIHVSKCRSRSRFSKV